MAPVPPAPNGAPRPGRPRSPAADRAILDATRQQLAELGYAGLTVEGVATRAGVAKTTVYRRWTAKADLVVDAVVEGVQAPLQPQPTGDGEAVVRALVAALAAPEVRGAYLALFAEAQVDPVLRARVHERLVHPARRLVAALTHVEAPDADPDLVFDLVAGAVLHRVLITARPADEPFVRQVAQTIRAAARPALG
jgi:AcrR family transcriptional regulator